MKKLVPNTIIPESLYVERVADEQLSEIIHDMGRPGYILVARQMGKTNLLINAKRKLETPEDIFAYIDLSNRYDTDRECFRSIVDTILETNQDQLDPITEEIYSGRESTNVAAHREHSIEIRKILKAIKGKLIINLDEIDSLTSADYSDKIFAHVRSIYFQRINFKEYERLSYILSGVAEPSEIIKDKSISPFNIGQKILLGDFSYSEFENFISKAELSWPESIKKRIFHWCNGNPRLSWEICSSLEDLSVSGTQITESHVDQTVKDFYLTKFDRPPIDHIRSLVESDKELREAVIAIIYEKSDVLSDRVKSRLYLAGILGSDYEFGCVRIKNRVIEESLDESWLSDLEKTNSLSINKAEELFIAGKYESALEIYQFFSKKPDLGTSESMSINYKLGLCYFNTRNYRKAIESYQNFIYDKSGFRDLHMDQLYTLGMSYYQLGEDENASEPFNKIIDDENNPFYHEALMCKAAILARSGEDDKKQEAIKLNEMIIDMHEKGTHLKKFVISGAYYNLGILSEEQNRDIAAQHYLKSADSTDHTNKVTPLISAISLQPEIINDHLETIKESLASGKIHLDAKELKTGIELTHTKIASLTGILFKQSRIDEIDSILELVKEHCLYDKTSFTNTLFEIAILNFNKSGLKEATYFLQKAVNISKEYSTPVLTFNCNKYLSFIEENNANSHESYLKGFQNYVDICDVIDLRLFERIISKCIAQNNYQKAISYCDLIIDNEGLASKSNEIKFFTILYLKMQSTMNDNDLFDQAKKIRDVAEHIESTKINPPNIDNKTVKFIRNQVEQTLAKQPVIQFTRPGKKYGRNEKVTVVYEDGRKEYKKYKVVSECIKKGICTITH
jgi:tetratricopeptide (TPR) repeat protein